MVVFCRRWPPAIQNDPEGDPEALNPEKTSGNVDDNAFS